MTRAVYAKLWSMTDQYKSRRHFGFQHSWSSFGLWLITPGIFVAWLVWPMVNFEWKKKLTFGLWVDPYKVRRYEGQEGFTARHG